MLATLLAKAADFDTAFFDQIEAGDGLAFAEERCPGRAAQAHSHTGQRLHDLRRQPGEKRHPLPQVDRLCVKVGYLFA
jgi:hypothetical protein